MIFWLTRNEAEVLEGLRVLKTMKRDGMLPSEIMALKRELEDLKIAKARVEETHQREERELRHMIGLEKKRQEVEIVQARRETTLTVREENLAVEQARFTEQIRFNTERFEKMETYLKEMIGQILERLPTVVVDRKVKR